jgi:WD40 repeat protein
MSRGKAIAGVGLFSLVLLGVLAALAQTAGKPPTELYVRTSPPGAKILVDGKECGSSPGLFEVEPGEHTVTVVLAGHEPKTKKVTIREGRIRRVILELQKGPETRDQEPEAGREETPWGKAVEGVQCRLRADKSVWRPGEVPTFSAEIRNRGTRTLRIAASQEGCELVLDGKSYHWPGFQFVEMLPLHPGSGYDVRISVPKTWFHGGPATLTPGEHKLSVRFQCLGVGDQSEKLVALVESNTVEFEIRPAGAAQPDDREKARAADAGARRVVESFLAAAIAGRTEEAIRMTDPASAVGHQIEDVRGMAGAAAMKVVQVRVKDNTALALTTQVKDDRGRDGLLLIRLIRSRGQWLVQDIDFTSPAEARSKLEVVANPIEIVPDEPGAEDEKTAWGPAVEGVQCRVRAEKPAWPQGSVPKLLADLRNQGQRNLRIAIESESWEIEIDGTWHRPSTAFSGDRRYLPLGPAGQQENLEVWIPDVDNLAERLRALQPGKHTLRVARLLNSTRAPGEEILRLVSNPIEIEIVPTKPTTEAQKGAWGPAVEGVQIRLWAEKKTWRVDEEVILKVDCRNQGKRDLMLDERTGCFEVDVDHRRYSPDPNTIYLVWPAPFGPGQHYNGRPVGLGRYPGLELAPGKHTICVVLKATQNTVRPVEGARVGTIVNKDQLEAIAQQIEKRRSQPPVVVSSNPIEIEIVPAQAAAASGVSREARPSPRKLMSAGLGEDVSVLAVAFSPSGKTLATVDEAGWVKLRNARAGTETLSFNLLGARERQAIFGSARRQKILTGGIAFSPDGMTLAVGGGPVVKLYDVADGRLDLRFVDKRLVEERPASEGPSPPARLPPGGERGESSAGPPTVPYAHGQVFCVAFSPDGTLLATSGDVVREVGEDTGATGGKVKLWDTKTGELKRDLGEWYGAVRSVAFSPDGKTLASIGTLPPEGTSSVRLWDPQTGTVKSVLPIARGGIPWSVAFSPDGKLVAACALVNEDDRGGRQGERGCKLLVWNAQTGAPLGNGPLPGLAQLSFSADSKTLAAGVDGLGVTLWDPETLAPKGEIQPSTEPPRDIHVAFSPIGNLLAVGAKDAKQGGFITVWEITQPDRDAASEPADTETVYVCRRHPQVMENRPGKCPYCQQPLEAKRQAVFVKNLKQIGLAMIQYVETNGTFPPAYSTDKGGKPLLSWRVQILPLLGQQALYERFHPDEPWDSQHNKRLVPLMPEVFKAPGSNALPGKTNYLTVRGDNTVFPGKMGIPMSEILDGLSNTVMVVEASDAKAVLWTKPEDYQYHKNDPTAGLVGLRRRGFGAVLCDGSVCFIRATAGAEGVIDALFTRNDGLAIEPGQPVAVDVDAGVW